MIDGNQVNQVASTKFVGIYIDEFLTSSDGNRTKWYGQNGIHEQNGRGQNGSGQNGTDKMVPIFRLHFNSIECNIYLVIKRHK